MRQRRAGRFLRREDGSVAFEALLILPLLMGLMVVTFVLFDLFRAENTNAKASYAIADLMSRQVAPVDAAYLEGVAEVYRLLARARDPSWMRVTSLGWDDQAGLHVIRWSHGTDGAAPLDEARLAEVAHRLPPLSPGETLILVETVLTHSPPVSIGIPPRRVVHAIPTRPRFVPRLLFSDNAG